MDYLVPVLIFVVLFVVGYLFKIILDSYLSRLAKKKEAKLYDKVARALGTPVLVIFLLIGIEVALRHVVIPARISGWVHPAIYFAIGIVVIAGTSRVLSGLIVHYGRRYTGLQPLLPVLPRFVKILVWFVGLMVILAWLGISISPLLVSFGVGGFAIALALQGTLANFFAGLNIMMEGSIKPGNYVRLQSGEEGYVRDIGWRTTKIRMLPNNTLIIPNSKLAEAIAINFYLPEEEMSTLVDVGVSYDSDLRKVEEVTVDVAKKVLEEVPGGVEDFKPFIRYHTFGDFSIKFTVILRVKEYVDRYLVTTEFVKALRERYREEGIEVPFPIRTVHLRKRR